MALGAITVLLAACGGQVDASSGGSGGTAGSGSRTGGKESQLLLGQLSVTTEAFEGKLLETFTANLQPLPNSATFSCPGATAIVGDCCVFPPIRPPPDPVPGKGPGTGAVNIGTSAGALALLDATTSASIGTFDFGTQGYAGLPAAYYATRWRPGDILTVNATGGQIPAFNVSAPALSPPIVQAPSTIVPTEDLKITWEPDPNADTLMIQIDDEDAGAIVLACSVPDSDGALTVDASLFASFKSGDTCQVTADRTTTRYAQTPAGRVELDSFGYSASAEASVK
jgi:hypothetical protein